MSIANIKRIQAVVWLPDDQIDPDAPRTTALEVMREKVHALAETEGEGMVRNVRIERLESHDPEFQTLVEREGYAVPGCSPWMSVWEFTPVLDAEDTPTQ